MSQSEDPPSGARRQHGQKGNKGQSKSRSGKSKKREHKNRPGTIPADAVVSLTPQGRDFFNMLLEAASVEARRPIVGEDLLEVLRRVTVRAEDADAARFVAAERNITVLGLRRAPPKPVRLWRVDGVDAFGQRLSEEVAAQSEDDAAQQSMLEHHFVRILDVAPLRQWFVGGVDAKGKERKEVVVALSQA